MSIDRETAIRLAKEARLPFMGHDVTELINLCNLVAAHQAKQDEELMRMALEALKPHGSTVLRWYRQEDAAIDALTKRLEGV